MLNCQVFLGECSVGSCRCPTPWLQKVPGKESKVCRAGKSKVLPENTSKELLQACVEAGPHLGLEGEGGQQDGSGARETFHSRGSRDSAEVRASRVCIAPGKQSAPADSGSRKREGERGEEMDEGRGVMNMRCAVIPSMICNKLAPMRRLQCVVVSMGREKCWGGCTPSMPREQQSPRRGRGGRTGVKSQCEDWEVEACVGCPDVRTGSFHSGAQLPHSEWLDPCSLTLFHSFRTTDINSLEFPEPIQSEGVSLGQQQGGNKS